MIIFDPCPVEAEAKGLDVSSDFTSGAAVAIIFIGKSRVNPRAGWGIFWFQAGLPRADTVIQQAQRQLV